MLEEAGRNYDPVAETPMFQTPNRAAVAVGGHRRQVLRHFDATINGGWLVPNEPYVVKNREEETHGQRMGLKPVTMRAAEPVKILSGGGPGCSVGAPTTGGVFRLFRMEGRI